MEPNNEIVIINLKSKNKYPETVLLEKSKNPEGLCQSIVENGKLERNKPENLSQ